MKKFVLLCMAVWSLTAVQAQTVKEVKDSVKAATKAGIFTFNHNGTYSRSLSGQKASGTWMTAGEQVLLAVKNVQTAAMVSHMENDTLTLVADLSKTLSDIQKLGGFSDSKANNTLLKLSKRLKGLKVGFLLARRKQ